MHSDTEQSGRHGIEIWKACKKEEERDTADKIFETLLNRFGSGMKGHQAMMRFEKRRLSGKKIELRGLMDTGAVLCVIPIETWERVGFDKDNLIDSRIRLSAASKETLRVLGKTPSIALILGERNLWMNFLVVENLDESD